MLNIDSWSDDDECQSKACKFTQVLVLGCNPLYPAWLKLRTLYCHLKELLKLRQVNITVQTGEDLDDLLSFSKIAVLAEASLELGAPNDNFRKNICWEDDLRSRIFGTFVVKFLACLPLLGFSNI